MFMQGIKRWLRSVFAWLTQTNEEERAQGQSIDSLYTGRTQETMYRSSMDSSRPRSQHIVTVSMEPVEDDEHPDWSPFENHEHTLPAFPSPLSSPSTDAIVAPGQSDDLDMSLPFSELYDHHDNQESRSLGAVSRKNQYSTDSKVTEPLATFSPDTQQRLEFLRYLVQRGIVNDDIS